MKYEIEIKEEYKDDEGAVIGLVVLVKDTDYEINLKWDGCINLWKLEEDGGYGGIHHSLHLCDVKEFCAMLLQVEQFRMDNIDGAE